MFFSEECFHHKLDSHWAGGVKPKNLTWRDTSATTNAMHLYDVFLPPNW